MTVRFGIERSTAPLRRALVRPPDEAFAVDEPAVWHYSARPDLERARREHAQLVRRLEEAGVVVETHRRALPAMADAIFVFDPVLMTRRGAIVLRLGKRRRRGEEEALAGRLAELGVPIVGRLEGTARAEGGDLVRLDERTLAVGLGFRTNREGYRQLARLLAAEAIEVRPYDLPYHRGPAACLHLRSLVSLLAADLALVYRPLLPVALFRTLEARFELIDVPDEELATQGPNALALGDRRCLVLTGSPRTAARLRRAGCEVAEYAGEEISHKAEGGPSCLVLPLLRSEEPG